VDAGRRLRLRHTAGDDVHMLVPVVDARLSGAPLRGTYADSAVAAAAAEST
jgi:hypothetical protein